MREVSASQVREAVKRLAVECNLNLGEDMLTALRKALPEEESPAGKMVLEKLIENAELASAERMPICQDTGLAVVFVEMGQDVHIKGDLAAAINEGVRQGYQEGYLRKSAADPLTRKNTGDNTPAIIYYELVPGERLRISFMAKGGGAENMSTLKMLKPAEGLEGVKSTVVEAVSSAGANPCPPIIVGVGIGGTFELAALNAKKALLREVGTRNPDPELADLEKDLLDEINKLGIGPQGYGGRITALAVFIRRHAGHIASLAVAVNLQCHANRHMSVEI
jgi:fumarate hydratase subunit alpha